MTQPPLKKVKRSKELILSAATVGNSNIGWRHPTDRSRSFSNSLEPWIEFAQLSEQAKLHNIFIVDQLSWYDVYGGDFKASAKHGVNSTRIDPAVVATAIASKTESLGIAITFSTVSEHPYHFARRLASLDLLTKGRVSWNIVGSYLKSLGPNLLNGENLPEHDERYVKTREYLDVVYELLLSSWREDAIVYDKNGGIFADPEAIRKINHKGKYFSVEGPSITEPTPQGFPLIAQAGTSTKGVDFAAENAELVFINIHNPEHTKTSIQEIRKLAKEKYGRDSYSIKFIAPFFPILGKTHEDAVAKAEELEKYEDPIDALVYFGGLSNIDLSVFGLDDPVEWSEEADGLKSATENIVRKPDGTARTPREITQVWKHSQRFIGSGQEIALKIQELVEETDIDGLNLIFPHFPDSFKDVVDYLIPELQRLGLAQTEYKVPGGTFRENFYGIKGGKSLDDSHPANKLRWKAGVDKEEFEKQLRVYKQERERRRAGT